MEQLFKMSLHTHMLSIVLLILAQGAYFWIKTEANFILFVKKVKLLYLIQSIFFGMVVFTGLLMLAVMKFEVWNVKIFLMIFVSLAILVHQILLYKKLRPIRSDEKQSQETYKNWASKVFGAEMVAEIAVFVIALVM